MPILSERPVEKPSDELFIIHNKYFHVSFSYKLCEKYQLYCRKLKVKPSPEKAVGPQCLALKASPLTRYQLYIYNDS